MRGFGIPGAVTLLPLVLLGGCGSSPPALSETTTYECALGRRFQVTVRPGDDRVALDTGPMRLLLGRPQSQEGQDRERRPDDTAAGQGRFTNGIATLVLSGDQATLEGVPGGPYTGCAAAGPGEKTGPGIPPIPVE